MGCSVKFRILPPEIGTDVPGKGQSLVRDTLKRAPHVATVSINRNNTGFCSRGLVCWLLRAPFLAHTVSWPFRLQAAAAECGACLATRGLQSMVSCCDCVVLIASSGADCMRGSARVVALLVRTDTCMHTRVLNTVTARA